MDFVLFTPTLNRFDDCNNLIRSALEGTKPPISIEILDNSGGLFLSDHDVNITIAEENLGVARSFNYGLTLAMFEFPGAMLIISNDDLVLYPDTLAELERGIEENPDELIYCTGGLGLNAFSLFACNPTKLVNEVGFFEIAYFSYMEDNDLVHRIKLLGKDLCKVQGCEVAHHVGSATIAAYTAEQMSRFNVMRANGEMEYIKKWGVLPHSEIYTTPYNSGIEAVGWHRRKFSKVSPYLL